MYTPNNQLIIPPQIHYYQSPSTFYYFITNILLNHQQQQNLTEMNPGASPWTKFVKHHERSYTCQNEEFDSVYDRLHKISIQTDERYHDPSHQQPLSTCSISTAKQSVSQSKKFHHPPASEIRSTVGSVTSSTYQQVRGNITSRTNNNKSQVREKTPQDISRDLEKVQRIIEIDHDIMKSQIKNLNSEYRNKKQTLESQNKVLADRVKKLEGIVLEDKKEIIKFKSMFEEMFVFMKDKFVQQADINNSYLKQINELKGNARMESINNRANKAMERSSSKRSHSPFIKKQQTLEKNIQQKYVERIKLLEFQLSMKNKELIEYKERVQNKSEFEIGDNSLTFDIQKNTKSNSELYECSFSKNDKSIESIMLCCEELSSLSHKLLMATITDHSVLDHLDRKLLEGLSMMKDLIGSRDFSMLSKEAEQERQAYGIN